MDIKEIFNKVKCERDYQDKNFNNGKLNLAEMMLVLSEEYGEAMSIANELYFLPDKLPHANEQKLRMELIQMISVAVQLLERDNLYKGAENAKV